MILAALNKNNINIMKSIINQHSIPQVAVPL